MLRYPDDRLDEPVSNLTEDETVVLDALVRRAHENSPDAPLSIASLLESTELSRPVLIEAMEMLDAEGNITVHWNHNGMFHARLTESGRRVAPTRR